MPTLLDEIRCPTCGARQAPSAECRRCKCDLDLYVSALDERERWRFETLRRLRDAEYSEAVNAARRCWSLSPDEDAARLLAVASLLAGRFYDALETCELAPSE